MEKKERDRLYHGSVEYKAKRRKSYAEQREQYRLQQQKTYIKHREKRLAERKEYVKRNKEKVAAAQHANYMANREKRLAYIKAWREANPTYNRDWTRADPERNREYARRYTARKKGAVRVNLSVAQWREIKEAFNHCCAYCGRKMKHLTQDHITPTTKNGDHHIHNIVPACVSCNSKKHTGPPLSPVQPLLLTIAPERKKKKAS
jgi:predicted restriction endonuclease